MNIDIGGGWSPTSGHVNLDPAHGEGIWRRRIQDGIPVADGTVETIRASHVLEHVPTGERIDIFNECHRALRPGGLLDVVVPMFPSWQAVADPTHVSYFVEQSFWYFTGQWVPQADYGIRYWRWASEDGWRVVDGWEGHARLVKP